MATPSRTHNNKGVAPLIADPACTNSTTRQNSPTYNPPLYIAVTFGPVVPFNKCFILGCPKKGKVLTKC